MTRRLLKTALMASLLTALLGGCTVHYHHHHQPAPQGGGKGEPTAPMVLVSGGTISVDQDVLRFTKDQTNVRITWRLQSKDGSKLTFPPNGVVFERAAAQEIVECQRNRDNTEFSCINRHSKPGVYRYGINVDENGTPLKPLDPFIWND